MNIFFIDEDPRLAAASLCDKHLSKMQLETAQMICGTAGLYADAQSVTDSTWPKQTLYKQTHMRHPSAVWARATSSNMRWLLQHLDGMRIEWALRGHLPHKSNQVGAVWGEWLLDNSLLPDDALTNVPLCCPEQHWHGTVKLVPVGQAVPVYRRYYLADKAYMAKWPEHRTPGWWTSATNCKLL